MVWLGYTVMCLIFGTTFLMIKVGIDAGLSPFFSAGLRFLLAGALIFVWALATGKVRFSLLWRKDLLPTGIGLTFGTFATLYWAEQYVSSGLAAILSATGPIFLLLIQSIVLRNKASRSSVIGCVLGFAGVGLLVAPNLSVETNLFWVVGCGAILIGELFYASGALYAKRALVRYPETSPLALNAIQMMHGGILLLVLSLFTEREPMNALATGQGIGALLYLTVVGSMMGHSLFYWLVARTNPFFPTTWLYISPLIAFALGALLYGEAVTWGAIAGGATIIVGILLVNLDTIRGARSAKRTQGTVQAKQAG
ncbi:DMT family transporter [Paenibacillus tyrfis]|uniref:DMT family transporter n=1 Tax=Paenibacillus tyrfis TaxID=1501230 RepID=UPI000B58B39B|nr:EamA family transporter [Paenibacillus tyrfis]